VFIVVLTSPPFVEQYLRQIVFIVVAALSTTLLLSPLLSVPSS
jgi:hypothetical protein